MDNRAWIFCTKWLGRDAYSLAKRAVHLLQNFGYDIELDTTQSFHLSFTQLESDSSLKYRIGIKEIAENPYKKFSIREALTPTVACFHEVCGHGGQWRNEIWKETSLSKVLLLNDLACRSSTQFYGFSSRQDGPKSHYFE